MAPVKPLHSTPGMSTDPGVSPHDSPVQQDPLLIRLQTRSPILKESPQMQQVVTPKQPHSGLYSDVLAGEGMEAMEKDVKLTILPTAS